MGYGMKNQYGIRHGGNGLWIRDHGSAVLSGSLPQNSDASIKENVEDVELSDCMDMLENTHVKTCSRHGMKDGNKRVALITRDVKEYLPEKNDYSLGVKKQIER